MKKGFTLVEVLAVIVILAVIALLVVPKVNNTIKNNKEKVCNSIKTSAEDAANSYTYMHTDEIDLSISNNGYAEITLLKLMEEGLLKTDLENPYTKEEISKTNTVKITKSGNTYNYEYTGVDCK